MNQKRVTAIPDLRHWISNSRLSTLPTDFLHRLVCRHTSFPTNLLLTDLLSDRFAFRQICLPTDLPSDRFAFRQICLPTDLPSDRFAFPTDLLAIRSVDSGCSRKLHRFMADCSTTAGIHLIVAR